MNLIEDLTTEARKINFSMKVSPPLSFNNKLLYTDKEYWALTGIRLEHFDLLCQQVNMRNTENRSASMAIGCRLVKLRLGLSNTVLATLFSFSGKRTVGHVLESARVALMKNFVQYHLGFEHITPEAVIREHTRPLSKQLFPSGKDVVILAMNGTYLYVQKSGNNRLQQKLYSIHKNRPLIKPMMICPRDGYIVSAMSSYLADVHNNDASITNHLLRTNQEGTCDWMRSRDVVVVDRGFRDILPLFQSLGWMTYMPTFLPKSTKKFSTEQANNNRKVTKIRWVIEAVNGRLKQYKYFGKIIPNTAIPYIHEYAQIVCAIINTFRPPFVQDTSNDNHIAQEMLARAKKKNKL